MDTLKLDDTGDLCLCKKNNLAIYRDLNAVKQTCENYVKAKNIKKKEKIQIKFIWNSLYIWL